MRVLREEDYDGLEGRDLLELGGVTEEQLEVWAHRLALSGDEDPLATLSKTLQLAYRDFKAT